MKLLGIVGCLTPHSKTRKLVETVLNKAKQLDPEIQIELLDLHDYDVQFCDGRNPINYEGDTRKVIDKFEGANAYVIATPIYQGSLTGSLKNLFDLIPPTALYHKVVGFIANGGSPSHTLVIENQLIPIAGFFHAYVVPHNVYAHNVHFNSQKEIVDEEIGSRLNVLAKEVLYMSRQLVGREV